MEAKKAAIYLRVSSKRQATHGRGLQSQEGACRTYCEKQGLTVVTVEQDICSGVNFDRPGLKKIMDMCERREIDALVCFLHDRLTRSMQDFETMDKFLKKHHVRLETAITITISDADLRAFQMLMSVQE